MVGWVWPNADICWHGGWVGMAKCWLERKIRQKNIGGKVPFLWAFGWVGGFYEKMLTSADKMGWSKKGQSHANAILEWSPTYLQIHWGYTLFRPTTSSLVYCCWLMNHGIYLDWEINHFWYKLSKFFLEQ